MTYPVSGSGIDDGTPVSTTVKWYDPAKGCGFLVPDDGSPAIHCRALALAAVGLETLLAGAQEEDSMTGPDAPRSASPEEEARIVETPFVESLP